MFERVTLRTARVPAAEAFYRTVLPGLERLWIVEGSPPSARLHLGFSAPARADVDEFWRIGTAAGYRSDGEPGPRPQYGPDYYGAFLLDPDGNSTEAVHHGSLRRGGIVDHLWIRVADVAASRAFYTTVAPHAGFELRLDTPERARFAGASGSFSVLAGARPTEHLHIAFPAPDNATVDRFHAAATGAGYRDHGAPGERLAYHEGDYGAFVLDPDGNNVEVVCHNEG